MSRVLFCWIQVYDVQSSLVLQMSLYFNLVYYPVWLAIILSSFVAKVNLTLMKCLDIILQSFVFFNLQHQCFGWFSYLLLGIGVCCCCVMEATRIYLGMSGNLSEQVAELSTFWFTTLLVQLPLVAIILIVAFSLSQILEMVALSISSLLMAVQLCVSFTTLRNVSRLRQF